MMRSITFVVHGKAEPQGSARGFNRKGGGPPIVTSDNPNVTSWRRQVRAGAFLARAALRSPTSGRPLVDDAAEPIPWPAPYGWELCARFFLPRPKALKGYKPHKGRPDLDKLVRAIGDALTGILWRDDAAIVRISASKAYCERGQVPFVEITARESDGFRPARGGD